MKLAEKIKTELSKDLDYSEIEKYFYNFFSTGANSRLIASFNIYMKNEDIRIVYKSDDVVEIASKFSGSFFEWLSANGFKYTVNRSSTGAIHCIYITMI